MKTNEIFSSRLKEMMSKRKISQSELCKRINIRRGDMSHYYHGHYVPKTEIFLKICRALNTTPNYLLGYDDEQGEQNENNK